MPLPPELAEHPEDTDVVGDVDLFVAYFEAGYAFQDWQERIAAQVKMFEELF